MKFLPVIILIALALAGIFATKDLVKWEDIRAQLNASHLTLNKKITPTGTMVAPNNTTPSLTETPTATPSPKPMSFAEMNAAYGPCTHTPVLMYHHVKLEADAKLRGQTGLNVTPDFFRRQMQYFKDKGYTVVTLADIADYFNTGKKLPAKSLAITLDDAYDDNYTYAYPILKEFGFKATIFTPTGLVNNTDYLTWGQIAEMQSSGVVNFGNHTWSHHPSSNNNEVMTKEIGLADTQLSEKGLDADKVFAYPYGPSSKDAEGVLKSFNYSLAFTTRHGSILCKAQHYDLPRIRMGNALPSAFGL